ncbi:DegV family protein [Caproiciproducens faecalis]|uniref:DegV family protein n=1 Tax=Caproiciproducens faecalis TaxID=2820301 RepID=A0ABS7DTP3_9FIRM|nr:DegV family protein [Caproiciproducens faecalis]MBW7573961.1 DegV family protein [Caproiciproducens faecalis]
MNEYVIVSDATCDLPAALTEQLEIQVIPMEFTMSGKIYQHFPDAREMSFHTFYERTKNGEMSVTSQINSITYEKYFCPILEQGKDILYIAFSSNLSGTYQASRISAADLMERYSGRKIVCIDSKAASVGEGMLAYYAVQKKREGLSLEELVKWVELNRDRICHWFTVDDLNHLKRGGRVSAVSAVVGTALGIKPVLHVDKEGQLIPVANVRGRKKSLESLVDRMVQTCVHPEDQTIFIGHGDDMAAAEFLKTLVLEKFSVKEVIISDMGPVIGAHTGCGIAALFFIGTEK